MVFAPPGFEPDHNNPLVNRIHVPRLREAAAALASWNTYLSHPDLYQGPTLLGFGNEQPDLPGVEVEAKAWVQVNNPEQLEAMQDWDESWPITQICSVLAGSAQGGQLHPAFEFPAWDQINDILQFAATMSDVDPAALDHAYAALGSGYLVAPDEAAAPSEDRASEVNAKTTEYPYQGDLRDDLQEIRKFWREPASTDAHKWESEIIKYAVGTENCMLAGAEALVEYAAIFEQARQDAIALIEGLVRVFQELHDAADDGASGLSWESLLITGIVGLFAGAVSVATAGAGAAAVAAAGAVANTAVGVLGKAAEESLKTAKGTQESETHWWFAVNHAWATMRDIERDVMTAVGDLESKFKDRVTRIQAEFGAKAPRAPQVHA